MPIMCTTKEVYPPKIVESRGVWFDEGLKKNPPLVESKVRVCTWAPPLLLHNRWLSSACACVCPEGRAFVLIEAALRWVWLWRVRVIVRLAGSLWGPSFFVILPVHHQHLICSLLYIFSISSSEWNETGMLSAHTSITRAFISLCVWGYLILTDIDPLFSLQLSLLFAPSAQRRIESCEERNHGGRHGSLAIFVPTSCCRW